MREWQQDLVMYRITPAPPKMELQEYIELYDKSNEPKKKCVCLISFSHSAYTPYMLKVTTN